MNRIAANHMSRGLALVLSGAGGAESHAGAPRLIANALGGSERPVSHMPTENEPLIKDATTLAGSGPRPTGLKRRSVVLMIVLTVVTLGLYYPLWFLRRRSALNQLDAPRKLRLWPFLLFLAWFVIQLVVSILSGSAPPEQTIGAAASLLLSLVQLAVGVLIVVQCFFIKDILEDHLAGPEGNVSSSILSDSARLSGLMTFFFSIFYLQHVINRYIVGPARSSSVQPTALAET